MSKPSQVTRMINALTRSRISWFLCGPVGAGKSQVAKQMCDELKIGFVDVRLSQMDPTDIKGFPSPDAKSGTMKWLPASFLPPMLINGKPNTTQGLLFLDELNSAPQAVQASAYQLALDFRVGDYILPPGWTVGAAGNRAIDRSIVNKMPAALANRFVHVDFDTDVEDWVAYARSKKVLDVNIAFINFKNKLLHSFDPAVNPTAFPTPRSWFTVDKIMQLGLPSADEFALIEGTVGHGTAIEHAAFVRIQKDLPTVAEITVAPDTTAVPKELPAALHALTTTLGSNTTKKSFPRFLQYVERMDKEWQVVYIRDGLKVCNGIKLTPEFTKWAIANADVVL